MKKAVCVFLGLILAAVITASCIPASALSYVRGDADGDSTVTSLDVTIVQRVIAEIIPDKDGVIARRCDVTGGGLSLPDATAIQRYLSGLSDRYRIGETVGDHSFIDPTEDNQLPIL